LRLKNREYMLSGFTVFVRANVVMLEEIMFVCWFGFLVWIAEDFNALSSVLFFVFYCLGQFLLDLVCLYCF